MSQAQKSRENREKVVQELSTSRQVHSATRTLGGLGRAQGSGWGGGARKRLRVQNAYSQDEAKWFTKEKQSEIPKKDSGPDRTHGHPPLGRTRKAI